MTHAMVERIKFEHNRAVSVELTRQGKPLVIKSRCEIILSAGSIGSPQILQLSGVGPGKLLQEHGIEVVEDASEVGQNLKDHLQIRAVYKTKLPITLNDELSNGRGKIRAGLEYAMYRRGPLSMAASQVYAFCKTRLSNERPDIQYHFQPLSADSPGEGLHPFSAFTASVCQLRPQSRGSINIASNNCNDHPTISPNYLSTELDCQTAIESVRFTRRIAQTDAMAAHIQEELLPDPAASTDEAILDQARQIANTIYHPTSTCRMGADSAAVVDLRLRVNGVDGLRVVDASIMPEIVSGNTNAPTIMIAEKASDQIIEDRLIRNNR